MTACRYCADPLSVSFADLGATPLANSYLPPTDAARQAECRQQSVGARRIDAVSIGFRLAHVRRNSIPPQAKKAEIRPISCG